MFTSKHNLHRFLHAMRNASQCAAVAHLPNETFLILSRFLARSFYFDIERPPIPGTMPAQVGLTGYADTHRAGV
jgi:hypothetical protein